MFIFSGQHPHSSWRTEKEEVQTRSFNLEQ